MAEPSDATERKWRSDFLLRSRSLAPFPPADRRRYPTEVSMIVKTAMRDDTEHPRRIMRAFAIAMPPLWIALIITGFVMQSLLWSLVALAAILAPTVLYIHRVAFTGICPQCKNRISISPRQDRYSAGDTYSYFCDRCDVTWLTHFRPGGFVD